jgi:hypothetical protein
MILLIISVDPQILAILSLLLQAGRRRGAVSGTIDETDGIGGKGGDARNEGAEQRR